MVPLERSESDARAQARVGTMLRGKWRLDQLLGIGGMAAVYSATHRNGTRGAVKLLHRELSLTQEGRSRFLREGYVANKVEHPGAVRVLDDDVSEDGSVFLVMELLEGNSLEAIRMSRPGLCFSAQQVVPMMISLLGTLAAAHDKGIVHRDLKPDNLFLTRSGELKILDFGIARLREGAEAAHRTRTGQTLGTPAYMPPEQAKGEWDQVDPRSDLWAVGATMFTLLTGRRVHEADTVNKLLLAAMTQPAPAVLTLRNDLPIWLAMAIDRALAFDRKDRWPSARDMQQALSIGPAGVVAPPWSSGTLRSEHAGAAVSMQATPSIPHVAVLVGPPSPAADAVVVPVVGARSPALDAMGSNNTASPVSSDPQQEAPTLRRRRSTTRWLGLGAGVFALVASVVAISLVVRRPPGSVVMTADTGAAATPSSTATAADAALAITPAPPSSSAAAAASSALAPAPSGSTRPPDTIRPPISKGKPGVPAGTKGDPLGRW